MFRKLLPFMLVCTLGIVATGLFVFLEVIDSGGKGLPYWFYVVTLILIIAEIVYLAIKEIVSTNHHK